MDKNYVRPMTEEKLGQFEVLDRSHIAYMMFSDHVEEHTVVQSDPEIKAAAEEIASKMQDFYQLVAKKWF